MSRVHSPEAEQYRMACLRDHMPPYDEKWCCCAAWFDCRPRRHLPAGHRPSRPVTFPLPFIHVWRRGKWGGKSNLDCRECRICGRFEIWSYWSFRGADRARFDDVIWPDRAGGRG